MVKLILKLLNLLKNHKRLAIELFLGVLTAFSMMYGITMHKHNETLSDRLEIAENNIQAYQEIANNSQQACTVLKLNMADLKNTKDSVIQELHKNIKENKIKEKSLKTAATQTQIINVNKSKGVRGDIIQIIKDSIYTDTIQYNNLTKVGYTIGKDTVSVTLDFQNTQYLYTYKIREYKNKKNFFKRLFTLDFKKVDRYKYKLTNTNDLLKESDVRIIEQE